MLSLEDLKPKFKIHLEAKKDGVETQIEGSESDLMVAMTILVKEFHKLGLDKEMIEHAVDIAFMSKKEVLENTLDLMKEFLNKI